jgi:acetoin utilization deacetylase AcuC-like enzyme
MLGHVPGPDSPETPERLDRLVVDPALRERIVIAERIADVAELERVHATAYVRRVLEMRGRTGEIDHETRVSPGSVDAALHAAGVTLELVDGLIDGQFVRAFAAVRPPGHHAGIDAGGGYCVFHNVAIGAAHALARDMGPVLVVDWDVHHGNGTQEIFWNTADVCVVDLHQDDCFPIGSGGANERGTGAGRGATVNVPLPPGLGDADYVHILQTVLDPVAEWVRPRLVLVSAGFDAHDRDPHGDEQLSSTGFGAMTSVVRDLADRYANGKLGLVLEGGYNLSALAPCVRACVEALDGARVAAGVPSELAKHLAADALRGALNALPTRASVAENHVCERDARTNP